MHIEKNLFNTQWVLACTFHMSAITRSSSRTSGGVIAGTPIIRQETAYIRRARVKLPIKATCQVL